MCGLVLACRCYLLTSEGEVTYKETEKHETLFVGIAASQMGWQLPTKILKILVDF